MVTSRAMAPFLFRTLTTWRVTPSFADANGSVWLSTWIRAPCVAHLPMDALAAHTFTPVPAHHVQRLDGRWLLLSVRQL